MTKPTSKPKTAAKSQPLPATCKTEQWPTDKLVEYARNPRKNDHAVDRVASLLKEYGFRSPIIALSDGEVVDGHLRLKAARKLGLKEVPVVLADDLTPAQVKALRLSMNKAAEMAQWDDELLRLEFDDLAELGFDWTLTGFDEIPELPDFAPGTEDDQGKLDELAPKLVDCPHCGKEFDLREI